MARTKQTSCRRGYHPRSPAVKPVWPHKRGQEKQKPQPKARTTLNSQRAATSFIVQRSCSFLKLPRELRDEIYGLLIPSYTTLDFAAPTWVDNAVGRFFDFRYDMSPYSLTLLVLCQQIRAEANALLYGTNHFEFSIGRRWDGPSPFNTIRALPQSGISQIKACTVRVFVLPGLEKRKLSPIRGWLDETSKLLKQDGNLQEIEVEVGLDHLDTAPPSDLEKFEPLLKPLERLSGLKSATVKGMVTEAYGAEFKRVVEGDKSRKYKRKKIEADNEEEEVGQPRKKRQTKSSK